MAKHTVTGISRQGHLIREEVEAESSAHARRIVHAKFPGNEGLSCRALKHDEGVLDTLHAVLVRCEADRVAA